MERYANLSGDSSVIAFEIEPGAITVQFDSGMFYLYNTTSTSPANIQEMQRLARAGRGLGRATQGASKAAQSHPVIPGG